MNAFKDFGGQLVRVGFILFILWKLTNWHKPEPQQTYVGRQIAPSDDYNVQLPALIPIPADLKIGQLKP